MRTYQDVALEWAQDNPEVSHAGTSPIPPPEFIQAVEQQKLAERISALEQRVAELEGM